MTVEIKSSVSPQRFELYGCEYTHMISSNTNSRELNLYDSRKSGMAILSS